MADSNKLIIIEGKKVEVVPDTMQRPAGLVRTLIRLSVGSALLAANAVTTHLRQVEQDILQQSPSNLVQPEENTIEGNGREAAQPNSPEQRARYALIGLIIESQEQLGQGAKRLERTKRQVGRRINRILRPFRKSKMPAPVRRRAQSVADRGKNRIDQLVETGKTEEAYSRVLAQSTLDQLVENSLQFVGDNLQIQEFIQDVIQDQSLGMAEEALGEVRQR